MSFLDLLPTLNPWWASSTARRQSQHPRRRALFATLLRAVSEPEPDRRAVVLAGPRQSGKSTLLGQIVDHLLDGGWPPANLVYYDFFDSRGAPSPPLDAVVDHLPPSSSSSAPRLCFFDEVTRAPSWAASLKRLVDDARRSPGTPAHRYIVSDSAASILHVGMQQALQGRTIEHRLSGLSLREFLALTSSRDEPAAETLRRVPGAFERYVSLGGFPGLALFDDYEEARRLIRADIAELAIARDLDREGVDVSRVRDLFAYLVRDSGAVFNAAERARDLATVETSVDVRTIRKWMDLLEQCCLVARLEPWSPLDKRTKAVRQLAARPRIYAEDHGLVAAFDPRPDPLSRDQVRERVLETIVFAHLRELQRRTPGRRITYFGDSSGEIDFVVDGASDSVAIEVTASASGDRHVSKTLKACTRAGIARALVVHTGNVERSGDGWQEVSLPRFLLDLDSFLEAP